MKCPKCQTENREGAQFCGGCGQPLQLELMCLQCGHSNPKNFRFYDECGQALAEPKPTLAVQLSPEPTSFAGGRYEVKNLLGEGGMKKVYLALNTLPDFGYA